MLEKDSNQQGKNKNEEQVKKQDCQPIIFDAHCHDVGALLKESKVQEAYQQQGENCIHAVQGKNDNRVVNDTTTTLQHSRLSEAQVLNQQRNANNTVLEIVNQKPNNGTLKPKPYNTSSFQGIDLSLPANFHLYSNRLLYLITATYRCKTQMVDLTCLHQMLELAIKAGYNDRLYWIIVEDAEYLTQ
jgi:hypothetical protein